MSFNYRVVRDKDPDGEVFYGLYTVYYDKFGAPNGISDMPIIIGDSIEELKAVMIQLLDAFDKPGFERPAAWSMKKKQ
jgi:hypothetical protein